MAIITTPSYEDLKYCKNLRAEPAGDPSDPEGYFWCAVIDKLIWKFCPPYISIPDEDTSDEEDILF